MGRTLGAKNISITPPSEIVLSDTEKISFIADLLLEIVLDEQNHTGTEL
jgi:hypothetical protein